MSESRGPVMAVVLAVLLAGCSNIGYYAQAANGHLAVMRAAVPIEDVVRDPLGAPDLKQDLRAVQVIREFASHQLGLPDNQSYRAYADVGRPYVVWNVFAAPEFSLNPKRWCLLLVGCVSYRGYYDRQDAETLAAELRQEGYDTFVGGVSAYSTLGHFDDPILNTFLRLGTLEVARTVFHELAHQLIFVQGDTVFNESFATAVENEGLRRWLVIHGTSEQRSAFERQRARKAALAALMRDYRSKFATCYAGARSVNEQREAKARLFAALRRDYDALKAGWGGYAGYDRFFDEDLNNARLVSLSLYNELLPAFDALLSEQDHQLPLFYQRVAKLAMLGEEVRRDTLTRLLGRTGDSQPALDPFTPGTADSSGPANDAGSGCQ